jgi:hypothetical protein
MQQQQHLKHQTTMLTVMAALSVYPYCGRDDVDDGSTTPGPERKIALPHTKTASRDLKSYDFPYLKR